jgi:L-ribulose-5-phosphate 3-epimerase
MLSRRTFLRQTACGAIAASSLSNLLSTDANAKESRTQYRIGACDWSIRERGNPKAFEVAKQIGLDGVEVSFGKPGDEFDLRKPAVREQYLAAAEKTGKQIASLAMGILNQVPYATDPDAEQWVADVVPVMAQLKVKVCLMAFFSNGDIQGDRAKQDQVIKRLRRVAPAAENAGVVLGIESWMDADEHLRIVEAVNSPAVRVYYDVANMKTRGYDVSGGIRKLGKENICQIHTKENGFLLGQGRVNFPAVRKAIQDIAYDGWLIVEGATVSGKSLQECYQHNAKYLRTLFANDA